MNHELALKVLKKKITFSQHIHLYSAEEKRDILTFSSVIKEGGDAI